MSFFGWLKRPAVSESTIVELRSLDTPAAWSKERVQYDAWGQPHCPGRLETPAPLWRLALYPDGETSKTETYGTEWRHVSGAPVVWEEQPISPFPQRTPAGADHRGMQ